jgi:hypothetical protein
MDIVPDSLAEEWEMTPEGTESIVGHAEEIVTNGNFDTNPNWDTDTAWGTTHTGATDVSFTSFNVTVGRTDHHRGVVFHNVNNVTSS